jgi:DNA-binding transcriptional LysR family regulator
VLVKSKHLEVFCTLMVAGTMTRTSELMNMTQPAVSVAIAALERELGFELFDRRGGRLVPREEARTFFAYASRSLEAFKRTRAAAEQIRQGRLGSLSIAAYPSICVAFLPRLLTAFRGLHPDVDLRLVTRSSHVIRDFAFARQFDITISELPVSHAQVSIEPVVLECLCMMPAGHRLAERDVVTPRDLDGVPLVSILRDHMVSPQIAAAFQNEGARRSVVAEVEYFISAAAMIAAGDCIGIIDPITAQSFKGAAVFRPFRPVIRYEFGIISTAEGSPSVPAKIFLDVLRQELAALARSIGELLAA